MLRRGRRCFAPRGDHKDSHLEGSRESPAQAHREQKLLSGGWLERLGRGGRAAPALALFLQAAPGVAAPAQPRPTARLATPGRGELTPRPFPAGLSLPTQFCSSDVWLKPADGSGPERGGGPTCAPPNNPLLLPSTEGHAGTTLLTAPAAGPAQRTRGLLTARGRKRTAALRELRSFAAFYPFQPHAEGTVKGAEWLLH